jgi:hypothetical protein
VTGYSRASHASRAGDLALPIAPVLDRERARPVRDIVDLARHGDDDLCSEGVDPAVSTRSERGEQIESAGRAGEGKTGREESEKKEGSRERENCGDALSRAANVLTTVAGSLKPFPTLSTPRDCTSLRPARAPISPALPLMIDTWQALSRSAGLRYCNIVSCGALHRRE